MNQQTNGMPDPRKSYQMDLIKISYCVVHKLHWITDCPECIHMDYDQNPKVQAADALYEALIDANGSLKLYDPGSLAIEEADKALAKAEGK